MSQPLIINNGANGVFMTVNTGGNAYVAFAATVDGSNNPVLQIGKSDQLGNNFVNQFEFNCGTAVFKVAGTAVTVP